jgi:hypothetical protein
MAQTGIDLGLFKILVFDENKQWKIDELVEETGAEAALLRTIPTDRSLEHYADQVRRPHIEMPGRIRNGHSEQGQHIQCLQHHQEPHRTWNPCWNQALVHLFCTPNSIATNADLFRVPSL